MEYLNIYFITSKVQTYNSFYFFIPNKLSKLLYKIIFYLQVNDFFSMEDLFNYNNYIVSSYCSFFWVRRLNVVSLKNIVYSQSIWFKSSNWLERELFEFTNIQIINQLDKRKLLLDYNINYRESINYYYNNLYNKVVY